jgi:hypothetical protein
MSKNIPTVGEAALRYAEAIEVRRLLRLAYAKTINLPRLRLKVRATLQSADGAVTNARRFYDAAERTTDFGIYGDSPREQEQGRRYERARAAALRDVHLQDLTRQDMTACDRETTDVPSTIDRAKVTCPECRGA